MHSSTATTWLQVAEGNGDRLGKLPRTLLVYVCMYTVFTHSQLTPGTDHHHLQVNHAIAVMMCCARTVSDKSQSANICTRALSHRPHPAFMVSTLTIIYIRGLIAADDLDREIMRI